MSVLNKFKLLQEQLFRGSITDGERPKLMTALMKLKSVLEGRGFLNAAPIVRRRSDKRSGLH